MFSVCIPVYRYNAVPLVRALVRQRAEMGDAEVDLEILVYDDASPDDGEWGSRELRAMPGIRYVALAENLGRAAIRNRMARDATGTYLIMLDADAELPAGYLQRYVSYPGLLHGRGDWSFGEDMVAVGGRRYQDIAPTDARLHLHWWYGRERESDVDYSVEQGWRGFHSNNFMVTKALLLDHPFPEETDGYGHEDTLWGQQFTGTEVPLFRLNNAVVHLGLEADEVFLRKQHQAIRNLHRLKNSSPHLRTRLIDFAERFPRLTRLAQHLPAGRLTRYLTDNSHPDLRALDLLKLHWWAAE